MHPCADITLEIETRTEETFALVGDSNERQFYELIVQLFPLPGKDGFRLAVGYWTPTQRSKCIDLCVIFHNLPSYNQCIVNITSLNRTIRIATAALCTVLFLFGAACQTGKTSSDPLAEALASFELPDGFSIELVAAEPLLGDPVDMEIDEYGRLYVVEMPGYPLDKEGSGSVRLLSDTNADGRMDSSTVFAGNFVLPTSIMRWKKGVLVTDAPYVLYLEDTNADGKADVRDTVLTGFALSNPQHNLNSPVLGIDNWIYLAHEGAVSTVTYQKEFGDQGTEIYYPHHPVSPRLGVNANGRSVRFKPDEYLLEETSGQTQFGHTFDEWGRHFLVGNSRHIYQEVIATSYLSRRPSLPVSDATASVSDHGDAAEVFPITLNPMHQLLTDVGVITSACGITSYQGDLFPAPYDGHVTFVAEPVGNLVHVDKLRDNGVSFVASRVLEQQEFLASRDAKFRPVNTYTGPDGALYVVDYYRQIIEHPEWMGEEVIRSGELYNDMDKGRIYRVVPKGTPRPAWTRGLALGDATDEQLVAFLSHKNGWWRLNAQRLLIDRNTPSAIALLERMAANDTTAFGRLHALWTLEGLHALKTDLIVRALRDNVAGVRENAIKIAEAHMHNSPEVAEALLALRNDPDVKVTYQLLCTIGSLKTDVANVLRQEILFDHVDDPWMQLAALTAPAMSANDLLREILAGKLDPNKYRSLVERLATLISAENQSNEIASLITAATAPGSSAVHVTILDGLSGGLTAARRSTLSNATVKRLVTAVFEHPSPSIASASLRLLRAASLEPAQVASAMPRALAIASDRSQPDMRRAVAADFLGLGNPATYATQLVEFITPTEPTPVQLAALRALGRVPGTVVSDAVIAKWSTLTPGVQDAAIASFLHSDERMDKLLSAIEANQISTASVSWPRRVRLMAQQNMELRARARALFASSSADANNALLKDITGRKGQARDGIAIYQENCGLCHQIRGIMGSPIGPDLGTVHNWSASSILENIIMPDQSISNGFDLWNVELVNGETAQGIIVSETPAAITLRNSGSVDRTIQRGDIKTLGAMNTSIMPGDFGQKLGPQQLADLLAFLKENKTPMP